MIFNKKITKQYIKIWLRIMLAQTVIYGLFLILSGYVDVSLSIIEIILGFLFIPLILTSILIPLFLVLTPQKIRKSTIKSGLFSFFIALLFMLLINIPAIKLSHKTFSQETQTGSPNQFLTIIEELAIPMDIIAIRILFYSFICGFSAIVFWTSWRKFNDT